MVFVLLGLAVLAGVAAGTVDVAPALAAEGEGPVNCELGTVYTMSVSGNIYQVKTDGSVPNPSDPPISVITPDPPVPPALADELNGLALTKGGSYAYVVRDKPKSGVVTVYRHDLKAGVTTSYPGATDVPTQRPI